MITMMHSFLFSCAGKNESASAPSDTRKVTKRIGMIIGIKPEAIKQYKALHADSNPGVRDLLSEAHMENFLTARYSVKLNVLRGDTAIYASEWNGNDRVESHRDVKPGQLISDICRLILSPAKFTVTIGITDLSNRKEIKKI